MPDPPIERDPGGPHAAFDWVDILLGFFTLCAGFALAATFEWSSTGRLFKIGMASALLVVIVARRVLLGPPSVTAVGTRKSVLGMLGVACMLFGLAIAAFGGYLFFEEWQTPIAEPEKTDREAIEAQFGLTALARSCTRDGKVLRGRACMTPEALAQEAASDEQERAELRASLEAEKSSRLSRQGSVAGAGIVLLLVGIALDIFRSRRDAAA